jgi:protein-disulfide isomerase
MSGTKTNVILSVVFGLAGVTAGVLGTVYYYQSATKTESQQEVRVFANKKEKESYSLGVMIGQQVQATLAVGQMSVDDKTFLAGLQDAVLKNEMAMSSDEIAQNVVNLNEEANKSIMANLVKKALEKQSDLFADNNTPKIGSGDVTLVEFFDYNCPHCRTLNTKLTEFVKADNNVRVIYRPIGLVSQGSQTAALAVLAAHKQNKFKEMHNALMSSDKEITENEINKIVAKLKLNKKQFDKDLKSTEIEQQAVNNRKIFLDLGLRGVPSVFAAKLGADNKVADNNLIYLTGDSSDSLGESVNKLR